MTVHSLHLANVGALAAAGALLRPPSPSTVPGLRNAECMTMMALGAPILSPARLRLGRVVMVAVWEDEADLEAFLGVSPLGRALADGWHVRMELVRRWGRHAGFDELPNGSADPDSDQTVIAVTLARLRLTQLVRFFRWGQPVEGLVRDHPGVTFAVAAGRPVRSLATVSIWRSRREMTDMVRGESDVPDPGRHADAMAEQRRKDFHHEFVALRFRPLAEYGEWEGRSSLLVGPA